ncbi:MAG: hypothetical protein NC311_12565 [Muribaculaceae bacterium]|nr:hypothetical protein [Muribaculaceae bacterium]MCM1439678.1 hypothetical protein [Roseburia sp.]
MSNNEYLHLAITTGGLTHYRSCEDEDGIYAYLTHIGFPHEEAQEIACWAQFHGEGEEYEQDILPNVQIRIV